jgi:hypothetical protein
MRVLAAALVLALAGCAGGGESTPFEQGEEVSLGRYTVTVEQVICDPVPRTRRCSADLRVTNRSGDPGTIATGGQSLRVRGDDVGARSVALLTSGRTGTESLLEAAEQVAAGLANPSRQPESADLDGNARAQVVFFFELPQGDDQPDELRLELDGDRAHMPIGEIVSGPVMPPPADVE